MNVIRLKDGRDCIIRKANEKDAADIIRFSNIVGGESDYLSYGINDFNHSIEQEKQIVREYNDSKNRLFIVAVIDGSICGTLTFWGNSRKRLEHWGEMGVSVLKKYWNMGIGTALIQYLIDWADRGGVVKKIDLMVREDNLPAINLYKKMGFQVEGRIRCAMKVDGIYYDFFYMGRFAE